MYLYKRGKGAKRRVMHLAGFDRLGNVTGPLCNTKIQLDTSCNLPLGQPVCKNCNRIVNDGFNGWNYD